MSNIINLQDFKNKPKENSENVDKPKTQCEMDFEKIAKDNEEKAKKIAKERARNNNSVKRDYRLTPNDPNNKR